jgi:predicted HicB family RNase H-like nuclease
MKGARQMPQTLVRMPPELKDWIRAEAASNGSSLNSEILRSVRERKERQDRCRLVNP